MYVLHTGAMEGTVSEGIWADAKPRQISLCARGITYIRRCGLSTPTTDTLVGALITITYDPIMQCRIQRCDGTTVQASKSYD